MNKHVMHNLKVTRNENLKVIDLTYEDYDQVWNALNTINDHRILKKTFSV